MWFRRNKYSARRALGSSGRLYDSTAERDRAEQLRLLQESGVISELREQTRVHLVAGIHYRPDFDYIEGGRRVYEDVKGVETEVFRLKTRLWAYGFGPGILRVTKRAGRRHQFLVTREILPKRREVG